MTLVTGTELVFINIGWMVNYAGPSASDPTIGNFGHLKTHSVGHEAWNFKPLREKVYGYVPRSARIRLERIGGKKRADAIDGVTVVWMARNPRNRRTYIVGWYENATVYREAGAITRRRSKGFDVHYQVEAPSDDATLLPPDARIFPIPTAKEAGNLGQSPVWYGKDDAFRESVRAYIFDGRLPTTPARGSPRQQDPELRRKIERAAVAHATRYFSSAQGGNRSVASVEPYGKGWDLEATAFDDSVLKIEVKGISGRSILAELTPNEYEKMISVEHRQDYIVYILTEALEKTARAHIFRYDSERSDRYISLWVTDDDRQLKIERRIGARLTCT